MKLPLILLMTSALSLSADELKLKTGGKIDGQIRRYLPQVEIATPRGVVLMPADQLAPESLAKVPEISALVTARNADAGRIADLEKTLAAANRRVTELLIELKKLRGDGAAAEVATTDGGETKGKWKTTQGVSEADDEETFVMHLNEETPGGSSATLLVRFRNRTLDFYIHTESFLGDDPIYITAQFDDHAPERLVWNVTTDRKGAMSQIPQRHLSDLLAAKTVVLTYYPEADVAKTATFDVAGAQVAARPLRRLLTLPVKATPKPLLINGVPSSVITKIRADAAKRWASDFGMQEYEVKKQIEAYKKLHP